MPKDDESNGLSLDCSMTENFLLMHICCRSEYTTIATLELLLNSNIDVYTVDNTNSTCLTLACIKYRVELVEYLLDCYEWTYEQLLHCVICLMNRFNHDIHLITQHKSATVILTELRNAIAELNMLPDRRNGHEYDITVHSHTISTPRARKSISTPRHVVDFV